MIPLSQGGIQFNSQDQPSLIELGRNPAQTKLDNHSTTCNCDPIPHSQDIILLLRWSSSRSIPSIIQIIPGRDILKHFPPCRGLTQVTPPRIVSKEINWILKQKCHESICHPWSLYCAVCRHRVSLRPHSTVRSKNVLLVFPCLHHNH